MMNAMKALAKELLREVQSIDDYQAAKALLLDKMSSDHTLRQVAIEFAVETFLANEWRAGRSARWRAAVVSDEPRTEPAFGGGMRAAPPVRSQASFAIRRQIADVVLIPDDPFVREIMAAIFDIRSNAMRESYAHLRRA